MNIAATAPNAMVPPSLANAGAPSSRLPANDDSATPPLPALAQWPMKIPSTQNLGDYLDAFLAYRLAISSKIEASSYRLTGSVIENTIINDEIDHADQNSSSRIVFWNCGKRDENPVSAKNLDHSVFLGARGPLTRDALNLPPSAPIGDPALLIPLIHRIQTSVKTSGKTICVPHVNDPISDASLLEITGADLVIHPVVEQGTASLTLLIDEIASASFVLSGSLHAAIIACAYNIPFAFLDVGYVDLPFKWRDFSASIGIGTFFTSNIEEGRQFYKTLIAPKIRKPLLTSILASAPFVVHTNIIRLAVEADAGLATKIARLEALFAENAKQGDRLAEQAKEIEYLTVKIGREQNSFSYKLRHLPRTVGRAVRAPSHPFGFHKNGKPRGWLRKILFHKNGRVRGVCRNLVLYSDGTPRPAFKTQLLQNRLKAVNPQSFALSEIDELLPQLSFNNAEAILVAADFLPLYDQQSGGLRLKSLIEMIGDQKKPIIFASSWERSKLPGVLSEDKGRIHYENVLRSAGVVRFTYGPAELKKVLDEKNVNLRFAFLSFPGVADLFIPIIREKQPNATIIYDMVDFHAQRMEREAVLKNDEKLAEEAAKMKLFEVSVANAADITITISDDEKNAMLALAPTAVIDVLPNIFTMPTKAPEGPHGRRDILFVGGFWHKPNADAAIWFANKIFPRLRNRLPNHRFLIAGSNPTTELLSLANRDGIEVLGYIEDLAPLYASARVCVAPLRFGAGVKGKVGQAMAQGVPVVATSIGAEGMNIRDGHEIFVADDPELFATHIVNLIENDAVWISTQKSAQAFVRANFSVEALASKVKDLFND